MAGRSSLSPAAPALTPGQGGQGGQGGGAGAGGAGTTPEGFVVRRAAGFNHADFTGAMAKYVRANHIQTKDDWGRTWTKVKLS